MLHFSVFVFVGLLFINGWCIGQLMPLIAQSVYRDLDKRLASTGSVINSAITQLTQGFAIALIAPWSIPLLVERFFFPAMMLENAH